MSRAVVDAAAMAWVAELAGEGIQLVSSAGEALPTASLSYAFARALAIGVPRLAASSDTGISGKRARSAPDSGPDDGSADDISRT